jgi:DNA-binding MarR family transcriptional regulator
MSLDTDEQAAAERQLKRSRRNGATQMDSDSVIRLRRVVLGLARRLNAASVGEGLTPAQASVLAVVTNRGPLGLAELTEIEGLNPTMLSRVVGKLDSFGLVRRWRDPDNYRATLVEVTPDGESTWQRISAQRAKLISECVAWLPAEQETALTTALTALENLSEGLRAISQSGGLRPDPGWRRLEPTRSRIPASGSDARHGSCRSG